MQDKSGEAAGESQPRELGGRKDAPEGGRVSVDERCEGSEEVGDGSSSVGEDSGDEQKSEPSEGRLGKFRRERQ